MTAVNVMEKAVLFFSISITITILLMSEDLLHYFSQTVLPFATFTIKSTGYKLKLWVLFTLPAGHTAIINNFILVHSCRAYAKRISLNNNIKH